MRSSYEVEGPLQDGIPKLSDQGILPVDWTIGENALCEAQGRNKSAELAQDFGVRLERRTNASTSTPRELRFAKFTLRSG
jgi:hypothetical protein